MNAPHEAALDQATIAFRLNGTEITAGPGETIIEAADRLGVPIPRLCYKPGMRPDGNCRACMVEIKGERVLAPSCCRQPTAGMEVLSNSSRAVHAQKIIVELLDSDMPEKIYKLDSELEFWKRELGVGKARFPARKQPAADVSHPAMAVNLDACIQCTRCVRACREEQVNDVIGFSYRGGKSAIVFDLDDPMGESTCVASANACRRAPPVRLRRRTKPISPRSIARLLPFARTAASAASSPITSAITASCTSRVGTVPPITSDCASRVASASTTSRIPIG